MKNHKTLKAKFEVEQKHLAIEVGSGTVPVLGTPALLAFMENVASNLAQKDLTPDMTSVGIHVDMLHLKASKIGETIEVEASITTRRKKRIYFKINAYSQGKLVGTAKHSRAFVKRKNFEANV